MTMRPRLSRSFYVCLLAITGLLALSYFPLSRIRAASAGATIVPSAGKPLVSLKNPQTLKLTYTGSADAVAALQGGTATPTAMAAADFDADGAIDVIAGYSTQGGGVLAVLHGNPDAFVPKDTTLYQKAMKGSLPATFLSRAGAFSVPESPDLLATGDFNRDGYQDVLVAARGGSLYFLAGDGQGNLLAPQMIALPGQAMAMAATIDAHVAVSTDGPNGPQVAMFAPSAAGLIAGATYSLPARGDSLAWGNLGGGTDLAVGAGSNVVMFYNALATNSQTETVTLPFEVKGLALGDFIWDRDARTEISVLGDDGSVRILQHGVLNTAPVAAKDVPSRRAALRSKSTQAPDPTALGAWTVASQMAYAGSAQSGAVSPAAFSSPRVAASSTHDLMVIDAGKSLLSILDTSGKAASPSVAVSFSSAPVAALAMPQKIDASRDIVVLTSAQSAATLITAPPSISFNVTTTADEDDAGSCTTSSSVTSGTGGDGFLSLREAVCEANNNGAATSVINVPAGTFSLAIATFGGKNSASQSKELQVGIQSGNNITISGAGAGSTIIQQTNGADRIIEGDELLNGNQPLVIQNVTLQNGTCTDAGLDCDFGGGGGAILAGGSGDPLTLTNVTFSKNTANSSTVGMDGGAVYYSGTTFTISSSTFSGNGVSNGGGGAVFAQDGDFGGFLPGSLTITNSTFDSNSSSGVGGGLDFVTFGTYPATITGSTFTNNHVTGASEPGGGIFAETGTTTSGLSSITVSNSRFVGNSAAGGGTGFNDAEINGTVINNWWGCNGGPGASGCDTATFGVGTSTFTPWLVLSISANPTQILPSGTSTLTADLTHNSSATGGFSVPNGVPVTFGGTLDSSVNPTSTTTTSGQAISTYTAGSSAGAGSGTATVDNQQVSTAIDILNSVTVTTSPANLSITVDGVASTAPQTFNWVVGSSHTIATTSPQAGPSGSQYVFNNWSDGGAISHSVSAPAGTTTYTATFDTQYQLTTVASPSGDGTVTPASGSYFASGATIPVTATANSGFAFSNWTSTGGTFDSTTAASTNFHMPAAAATVTGNFVTATTQITITTSPANLLVSVDGGSFVAAPLIESWNSGSSHTIATTSPQSGGTGIQYAFASWSDGGAISHSITVPSTATTYTATFATQYLLTTAANPMAGGTVTPMSGNFFNSGSIVPLTATANIGYNFVNWTGNVANSTSASTTVTMTAPQSVIANFALIIVTAGTTTSVSSDNNPSFTAAPGNTVNLIATVSSTSTVNEGTVSFSDPANDFTCSGGNTLAVTNGQATCATSFTTEGAHAITASYNGTVNFGPSSGNITQNVNNHTVQTGNQFCNPGVLTIASMAAGATPYPSNIFVTGLSGNVGSVTVALNNISSNDIQKTDLLLVGPTGAQIVPFASVGDGSTINAVNITLDDSAATLLPGNSPLASGSFRPTSLTGSTTLVFPAPAPTVSAASYAAADGTATLASQFSGTPANGTWALYAMDNSGDDATAINGGWCVNISPATVPITITTSPAGLLVSADGGAATAAPLVENWVPGSSHTITTSSPQAGATGVQYVFNNWSDSGAISHSITVPSTATTYTAAFDTQYQLTTQASPAGDGTVMPASGSFYASGASIPVTAKANSGFTFSNWTATGGSFDSTTSAVTNFHMPAAPATVTGNFATATVQVMVGTSPTGLSFTVDGTTYTTTQTLTWNIGSSHTIATTSPQAGTIGTQYVFNNWSDGGAISHSVTAPSTATTYTASFTTQYQLTTAANPSNGGTVSPASGGFYNSGTVVPLTATPNAGFTFSSWTGNVANATSASTTITMTAPQSVTANFASAPQISVTPTTINFGNVYYLNLKAQNVTVKNTGTSTVTISNVSLTLGTGTDSDDFTLLNFCPKSLAVGKSCAITVVFFADNVGTRTATLNVTDNAAGSPQQVSLSGTVINPLAGFRPSSLNFGTVKVGHNSSTQNVTLTNIGTTTLNISSIGVTGANAGDFVASPSCPSSLAPSASCTIAVTFDPRATGNRFADLTVVDNAQISKQNVPLSGRGN